MLGLPPVTLWPHRGGPIPWILDPAKHPRPDDPDMSQNLPAPGGNTSTGGGKSRKRKKRNGKHREFKVTQKGTVNDEPTWVTCSSSSGSDASDTTAADSGVNLASPVTNRKGSKKAKFTGAAVVDGKREKLYARYVMQVLQSRDSTVVDSHHVDWGRDQNIGLYDIIGPLSMTKLDQSGMAQLPGKGLPIKVAHRYCSMCSYASENHQTLNNHVRLHFRMTMVCGFPDCWEVWHNATTMWTHTRTHGFTVSEPCATRPPTKKK